MGKSKKGRSTLGRTINIIALFIVIIAAINWGLIGLMNFNFIERLFSPMTMLINLIYVLVGVAGVYLIITTIQMLTGGWS